MDSMELERERGITIQSAATFCSWPPSAQARGVMSVPGSAAKNQHWINITDTPGHVDFTIEVERSLRALDGAIMVPSGVARVPSQSYTVDGQLRRSNVPRIAFINKLDRVGANPYRVASQLRDKLKLHPVLIQMPIGLEDKHEGVIDLVEMQAFKFYGENGETIERGPIPPELQEQADKLRHEMLDNLSRVNGALTAATLEDKV